MTERIEIYILKSTSVPFHFFKGKSPLAEMHFVFPTRALQRGGAALRPPGAQRGPTAVCWRWTSCWALVQLLSVGKWGSAEAGGAA